MSSISSNIVNTSRIIGLASGMDIDAMVKDMMAAARMPLDKLEQQKQILEWQQEDYRKLNSAIREFRNKLFDMTLTSAFNINSAALSNDNTAAVKGTDGALAGVYQLTVNHLATGVAKISTEALAAHQDGKGENLSLFGQFDEFAARGFTKEDVISININGQELKFDLGQDNIHTVVAKINNAGLGITANYDSSQRRFFLNTAKTGSAALINISSDAAGFIASGSQDSILKLNMAEGENYRGQNASVDFGDAQGLEFAGNTITINGLTLSLKNQGQATINVSQDIDAVAASIKGFIDSYNEVLSTLYGKLQEERHRDFAPLTEAQREAMSEDEIKKWEAKANSGLLRNDMQLQNLINSVRGAMAGMVEGLGGTYGSLSSIGITSGPYRENGKLHVDDALLKKALAEDPEGVRQLFTKSGDSKNENGFINQLYEITSHSIKYFADKAGSSASLSTVDESYIGKMLTDKQAAIEKWEKRLEDMEKRYYNQFTLMETMINQMNMQSAWLTSQFSSGA